MPNASVRLDPSDQHDPALEADATLWRAVIAQAIADGTGQHVPGATTPEQRRILLDQARTWFTNFGSEFREVCQLAGLDPEAVRKAAVMQFQEADERAMQGLRRKRSLNRYARKTAIERAAAMA